MAEEQVNIELLIQTSQAAKNVGELEDSMAKLQDAFKKANTEAERDALATAFKEAKVQADSLNESLVDNKAKMDSAFGNIGKVTAGIASGFAGATGALQLMGLQSEETEKTIANMMAALSIAQAAKDMGEMVGAIRELGGVTKLMTGIQKAFNLVLSLNPIALIVLAVTGIILAFQEWETEITSLIRQLGFLNDALEWLGIIESEQEAAAKMRAKAIKAEIDAIEDKIRAIEKARDEELAAIDDTVRGIDRELKVRQAAGEDVSQLERTRIEQILERVRVEKEATEQIIKLRQQEIEKLRSMDSKFYRAGADALEKKNVEKEKQVKELAEKEKDVVADLAAFDIKKQKEAADAYKKFQEERTKKLEEEIAKQKGMLEDFDKWFADEWKKQQERRDNEGIGEVNIEVAVPEKETVAAVENSLGLVDNYVQRVKAGLPGLTEEQAKFAEAAVMSAEALASSLGSISQLIGEESKKGIALQKAAAITQLLIDTAKGISSAVAGAVAAAATTGPAMPFVVGGYIATGIATVLAGIAQAKAILSKVGANVNLGSAGGGGGGSAVRQLPPRLAAVGGTVIDANRDQVQDMKVYVTETDISSTMSKVNVIENQAKIR